MNIQEVLAEAREIVDRGWYQGEATDRNGKYCLRSAIGLASGALRVWGGGDVSYNVPLDPDDDDWPLRHEKHFLDVRLFQRSLDVVRKHLPYGGSIPLFNDDSRTTKADVLAVLDKAIYEEGGEAPMNRRDKLQKITDICRHPGAYHWPDDQLADVINRVLNEHEPIPFALSDIDAPITYELLHDAVYEEGQ